MPRLRWNANFGWAIEGRGTEGGLASRCLEAAVDVTVPKQTDSSGVVLIAAWKKFDRVHPLIRGLRAGGHVVRAGIVEDLAQIRILVR